MGAALVPQKPIYRKNGDEEFYIFFSKETIEKVSQLFLKNSKHKNATMEHDYQLTDMTIVESWIVEDAVHDKSRKFGMEVPVGTWMVSMKVEDDSVWNDYVKTGKVKGFSIEGYFADRYQMSEEDRLINEIKEIIMREEKSVYKALFSEQEPKKVELGLLDDAKKELADLIKLRDGLGEYTRTILNAQGGLSKNIDLVESKFPKIKGIIKNFENQLKELGIDGEPPILRKLKDELSETGRMVKVFEKDFL